MGISREKIPQGEEMGLFILFGYIYLFYLCSLCLGSLK